MVLMMMMRDAERESFTHATDTPPSMMRAMLPPPPPQPPPSRSCLCCLFVFQTENSCLQLHRQAPSHTHTPRHEHHLFIITKPIMFLFISCRASIGRLIIKSYYTEKLPVFIIVAFSSGAEVKKFLFLSMKAFLN